VGKYFLGILQQNEAYKNKDFPTSLEETFLKMDEMLRDKANFQEINDFKADPKS